MQEVANLPAKHARLRKVQRQVWAGVGLRWWHTRG